MMRNCLVMMGFVLFFGGNVFAHAPADTLITLEEFDISAPRYRELSTGFSTRRIDTMALKELSHHDLSFLLNRHSGMFIKSYGPGVLATTSMRGGSAGQTAILWNGISLQNPMHNQSDLALLPVFFADEVSIQYGGGSALWGSGAMGGTVSFNNERLIDEGLQMQAGLITSGIGEFTQTLRAQWAGENFSTRLRLLHRDSENRYRFINTSLEGRPEMTQEHAALDQWGLLHEMFFRFGNRHLLDLRWWYQENARNIPPALQQTHTGARQEDEALRISAQWQSNFNRTVFFWRGALLEEKLLYRYSLNQDSLNQDSRSRSGSIIQEVEARWQLPASLLFTAGANFEGVRARSDEYAQSQSRNTLALFASARWEPLPGKLQLKLNGRQAFQENQDIPFAPSIGVSWKALSSIILKANTGRNYRLPSLNDLYWVPGGNPELKPEDGWSQDFSFNYEHPRQKTSAATQNHDNRFLPVKSASITAFHRQISDWIIWLPRNGGMVWTPENVMQVRSYGLESMVEGSWSMDDFSLQYSLWWDHIISKNTKAKSPNDASEGKQLIYVPRNKAGINLRITLNRFSLYYHHQHTGKRYTSSDNSNWLEPYFTGDAGINWNTGFHNRHGLNLFANVVNIWNRQYQEMAGRPMPLRFFQAGINFEFNSINP